MNSLSAESIRGLIKYLPLLQNQEARFTRIGRWGDMSSRVSTETARSLYQYLYQAGFVIENFDWLPWSEEALAYQDHREKLQQADLTTLHKILTTHMLADRFNEGHFDLMIENGFLADVITQFEKIQQANLL